MLIEKESGRRPPSKVQDMPSTTKLTEKTRHVPTAEHETKTEHKANQRGRFKVIQDMPRLMNKNPHRTQSKTTCLLKKKVAEGHLQKYKTCPQR